jgi:hypothetical protein
MPDGSLAMQVIRTTRERLDYGQEEGMNHIRPRWELDHTVQLKVTVDPGAALVTRGTGAELTTAPAE